MSCPYCSCSQCSIERQRWNTPWQPISAPFIPWHTPVQPGFWACGCGMVHPPGFVCTTLTGGGSPR